MSEQPPRRRASGTQRRAPEPPRPGPGRRAPAPRRRLTREQSRAQTRERLLEAAAELFAERGVNGASVEQICERAGYSRGALYANFADKQELVLALLEQRTRREYEEVRALTAGAASYADALDAMRAWHRERARHLEGWLALRAELWLYAIREPAARLAVASAERTARDAVAAGVRHELDAAGVAPPADVDRLALIVHALGDGLLMQRALTPDEIPEEIAADAVALVLRALVALAREEAPALATPPPAGSRGPARP